MAIAVALKKMKFIRRMCEPSGTCLPCGSAAWLNSFVPERIRTEPLVLSIRRERQRRAAAPAPDQLRREQLPCAHCWASHRSKMISPS